MKLYNFLTKKKEEFIPIHPGKVGMYVCGPTVYDHCHLGHGRGYVSMDILRRYLEYRGLEARHIMNYTDVGHLVHDAEEGEDKIEQKARKEKTDPIAIADKYIASAEEDFKNLNIKPAHSNPRPTQYIAEIIKFIEELIDKEIAYTANGSVYFSVDKFPQYGKLSGRKKEELMEGARVEINPDKKNPLDFALWIKAAPEHILKWESPWSLGYPGWHIECSVMSSDLLGQTTFDIHGGGVENVFPHNENEIAQSEAYLGNTMANFWVLWAMININGVKMSKSLGNFIMVKDAIEKYGGGTIRLWFLSSHYRSVINYSEDTLKQAKANLQRISDFIINLEAVATHKNEAPAKDQSRVRRQADALDENAYLEKFEEAMDDDLNTPEALAVLYKMITETNKLITENKLNAKNARSLFSVWDKMNSIFGLEIKGQAEIPEEILKLIEERVEARKSKDFQKSDEIRKRIEEMGYVVEDTGKGYKVKARN